MLALGALAQTPAQAAQTDLERAQADQLSSLRRDLNVVVDELQSLKLQMGVPESEELKSSFGLGPAASKVYGAAQGISLGGYAETVYRNRVGDAAGDGSDTSDFTRAVLYVGYKFEDWLVFNSELEFEHASTDKNGSVSVEFAALDFLLDDSFNVRAGLVLVPMGFVNEVHEPPFYYGTDRPTPEKQIIPSTWRANGVGIFGTLHESLDYRLYVVTGLDATGFSSSGLRGGRQQGSESLSDDLALVGRLDLNVVEGLRVGGSYYFGNSGQDQRYTQEPIDDMPGVAVPVPHTTTQIGEIHGEYRRGGLVARALYTLARVGDAGKLSTVLELDPNMPIAVRMVGGYAELGYDLMPWLRASSEYGFEVFFRYEYLDTQNRIPSGFTRDRSQPRRLFIPGVQFRPHPNVVLKLDYRNIDTWGGNTADEVSVGFGLVF
jgi:hypothetical protein